MSREIIGRYVARSYVELAVGQAFIEVGKLLVIQATQSATPSDDTLPQLNAAAVDLSHQCDRLREYWEGRNE